MIRLIGEYFGHCRARLYVVYEETDRKESPDYEYLALEDYYNSLNRKLSYTSIALPELQLEIARA